VPSQIIPSFDYSVHLNDLKAFGVIGVIIGIIVGVVVGVAVVYHKYSKID
jgi:hypothetical protein